MLIIELTDRSSQPVAINWDNVLYHTQSSLGEHSRDGAVVHLSDGRSVTVQESYEEILSRLQGLSPQWPKVIRVARPGGKR